MKDFFPEEHLGRIISRAKNLMTQSLQHAFNEKSNFKVTVEQWAILIVLWEEDGISQTLLAERALKDKPTTTRMLTILERRGVIVRRRDETDKRAYKIFLTDEGYADMEQLIPLAVQVLQKAETSLAEQEVTELKRMLKIFINNLE